MVENRSDSLLQVLNVGLLSRIRRNHGLEHATLHMLAERHPGKPFAGHSGPGGFWIVGDVPPGELHAAVDEAMQRLHNGERQLAIHPNCGTNLATAGLFAGLAASLAFLGGGRRLRDRLERLPLAATLATFGLILAKPMGYLLQERVTTSGFPESLRVVEIISAKRGRIKAYRVVTEG